MVHIGNSWDDVLKGEFDKDYYLKLREFLKQEYGSKVIYPNMYDIFNALKFTPYEDVKAVILGQDPYHEPGQAHGLCFSVQKGVQKPPSLVNIFKELQDDLGIDPPHRGQGWEVFTDQVIQHLNAREKPMVFILWGGFAKAKEALITGKQHCIIKSVHPSPLSAHRGYFGGKYFSRTNAFLQSTGQEPIDWSIPE